MRERMTRLRTHAHKNEGVLVGGGVGGGLCV